MQSKEIKYQGKNIHYRAGGEGQVVVLVHGFGEDGTVWERQLEALKNFHVIIPDLPGSGKSEMVADMSIEGMANVLEKLIVHETATVFYKEGEPGSVVMIGHSMGGYITLAFAELHPEMLLGFGLFHSSAFADSDEKKEVRRKGIGFIQNHGPYDFLKTMIPNLYGPVAKEENPEIIKQHLQSARNFSGEALVSYYQAMIDRPDRTHILKETKLPVLFIFGKHDTAVPIEDGLKQCHLPELSYIHILDDTGHMGMAEETRKANDILNEFLENIHHHHAHLT